MEKTQEEKDFTKKIEETSTKLAKVIVEKMLENFDLFMEGYQELSKEQMQDLDKRRMDFAINLLGLLAESDIPADYASYCLDKVIGATSVVQKYLDMAVRSWDKEILARVIGVKSPLDNGFDKEFATLREVMDALIKVRKQTGEDEYLSQVAKAAGK